MKTSAVILLLMLFIGFAAIADPLNNPAQNGKLKAGKMGRVVFEDNFDQAGRIPDTAKWSLCRRVKGDLWANYFSQSYDQAYVKNGKLILKAEKVRGIYKTGGVQTKGKVEFTYGKVEVRAKFVTAKGGWPAIWMIPQPNDGGVIDGEIDIMEQLNNDSIVYQTIHSHYIDALKHNDTVRSATESYNVNDFNIYAVCWYPEKVCFYVNGKMTFSYPNLHLANEATMRQWPYNKPFYLILNYALGGKGTWPGVITDSQLPAHMEVDWIKVTELKNSRRSK